MFFRRARFKQKLLSTGRLKSEFMETNLTSGSLEPQRDPPLFQLPSSIPPVCVSLFTPYFESEI